MKIEDLVNYIQGSHYMEGSMNKEKAFKHLKRRQSARSFSDNNVDYSRPDVSAVTGKIPVAEVKDYPAAPLLRRARTVAEFNSMRRKSGANLQPLFQPSPQFPPIRDISDSHGVSGCGLNTKTSIYGQSVSGQHESNTMFYQPSMLQDPNRNKRMDILKLSPGTSPGTSASPVENGLDIRRLTNPRKSSIESLRTSATGSIEDQKKQSIMTSGGAPPKKKLTYHLFMPSMSERQNKQVSFSEPVSLIDTYAMDGSSHINYLLNEPKEQTLGLTTHNIQLLETINRSPPKLGIHQHGESISFSATKPEKEVRLLKWLQERLVEVEEPIRILHDDIIHEHDDEQDDSVTMETNNNSATYMSKQKISPSKNNTKDFK